MDPAANAPKPEFTLSEHNLVVNNGGSAKGMTAVVKIKKGRDVQFVTVNRGNGNCQSLTHHPIFHDVNGEEHIYHKDKFRRVSGLGLNVSHREQVKRG